MVTRSLVVLVAASAALAGCKAASPDATEPPVPADAGDAGLLDAGHDRVEASEPPDAGSEAEAEASTPTLGSPCENDPIATDPIPAPYPPDAKRLPGLPGSAEVFEIPPPQEPLRWKSCGTGCRELETPWAGASGGPLYGRGAGGLVDGHPWLALRQRLPGEIARTWIGPADGLPVRVMLESFFNPADPTNQHGFTDPLWMSSDGRLFAFYQADSIMRVFGATPAGSPVCLWKRDGPHDVLYGATMSSSRWAADGSPGPILTGPWPALTGKEPLRDLLPPGKHAMDDLSTVTHLGQRLIWSSYGVDKHTRLWTWAPGEEVRLFAGAPDGVNEDHCCVAANGDRVVWIRGSGKYNPGNGARWQEAHMMMLSTPIATFPVQGVVVRPVPEAYTADGPSQISKSYWAYSGVDADALDASFVIIVRLSDGRLWRIPRRDPKLSWSRRLYLSDREIALMEPWFGYPVWASSVVRYELSSLGPGEPAPVGGDGGL